MADAAVEAMLGSSRSFAVAAAGCGKTELLGRLVADQRSGRQLVLTHTHAGVAAIKRRLAELGVPQEKFHLDTIAGWSLRYGAAYPGISGYHPGAEAEPDWEATYPGAEKVCASPLGRKVIRASYDGLLVDEYQDCTNPMHAVVRAIGQWIPYRGVGDPLQTIFKFREPCVSWDTVKTDFDVFDNALVHPWRWSRNGCNKALGKWLVEARHQLEATRQLVISDDAPVTWMSPDVNKGDAAAAWAAACRHIGASDQSVIAILRWPDPCKALAKRLGGRWPVVEKFDDPDLLRLGERLAAADGPAVVAELVAFVGDRMTGIGSALKTAVTAIREGRGIGRIKRNRDHADLLARLASAPTPLNALTWLDGVLHGHHNDWWLYRRDCVFQLRDALRHCAEHTFAELPDRVAEARTRARHRGRLTDRRAIGTPLLVKGLEFDHAVVFWEPDRLSVEGLYVALTRASKSLTVVSRSRTLIPQGT